MNKLILTVVSLAALLHLAPVYARSSEPRLTSEAHPISSLIGDWHQFSSGIMQKTRKYDKDSDILDSQLTGLPRALIGTWRTQSQPAKPGNLLQTELTLKANHKFNYRYVVLTGAMQQAWTFAGTWEVKNRILMLLIQHTSYPGEQKDDILFWRLLHVGASRLVYVRTGADEKVALTRGAGKLGS